MQETWVWSLSQKDLLATHSSVLVWRIPWAVHGVWVHGLFPMEKSMGSQRVRHNWATFAHLVCLFSHVSAYLWPFPKILVHYQRFSGAYKAMNFPERVICGQDYIPSFSEVQREKGEKTSGKQVETMLKRMKQSQKKNQKMRKKRGQSFHALFEFTTLPKFLHVWIGGSPNPLLLDFCGGFIIT